MLVKALCSQHEHQDDDCLKAILLLSIIFDGENSVNEFFKKNTEKTFTVENISYTNHYLTGDIIKSPVMFAGISGVLLAPLLNRTALSSVKFDIAQLDRYLNKIIGRGLRSHSNNALYSLSSFVSVALRDFKVETWSVITFFKHIIISPRQGETGVLFGLRQGTVKTKHLSSHALMRLISPTQFFPLNTTQELGKMRISPSHETIHF